MSKTTYLIFLFTPMLLHGMWALYKAFKIIRENDVTFTNALENEVYKRHVQKVSRISIILWVYLLSGFFAYRWIVS